MSGMMNAALRLSAASWAVIPLDRKLPAYIPGVVEHGHKDAITDRATIRRVWKMNPDYNIGSPVPANLLVLDVDPRNGGSIEALEERAGVALPPTLEVISGRRDGGRHLYFLRPFEHPYRRNIPEGIDLKVSGYMVMPPSVHPESGRRYRWVNREVASLPREVVRLMLPRRQPVGRGKPASTSAVALASWIRSLRRGERHDGLFWAASRAHEAGISLRGLELLVSAAEDIGFDQREARRVIESARMEARS